VVKKKKYNLKIKLKNLHKKKGKSKILGGKDRERIFMKFKGCINT
jgi:hypothetical protein